MARLYLFAEGQTEQTFADSVLRPHLSGHGVYLHKPVLIASARRKGRIFRGGGRKYLPMKNDILRFLKQEKGPDVLFTTMIDLYAIAADLPGFAGAEKLRGTPTKRVEYLEEAFGQDIGDSRFLPFIQLHEFETYLFVEPRQFESFYENCEKQVNHLQGIRDAHATPEMIDDNPNSAPSKRIVSQFPDYEDAKPVVGPRVAELIGVDAIRAACPHFHSWLVRLEASGSPARE
jgi:hypothetical protein